MQKAGQEARKKNWLLLGFSLTKIPVHPIKSNYKKKIKSKIATES